jgi:fumarylacetoacetase
MPSRIEIPADSEFSLDNLPYGVFSRPGEPRRIGVAVGGDVLDLAAAEAAGLLAGVVPEGVFAAQTLNAFMATGLAAWTAARERLRELLTDDDRVLSMLLPRADVVLHMPIAVGDYVDFYSSIHHATNVGRMFRPDGEPLLPNWRHLPVGYHGRAGTVVVSGTPIVRPWGQRRPVGNGGPTFGPTRTLDIEAEVGFVVGVPSELGSPVPADAVREHVFGVVLVNDWSARDIQAWEYAPLGPFLSKSFATSISPWVVPLEALDSARIAPPTQDPEPLEYLRCKENWGLDIDLEVAINGTVVSRPPFASMYWTVAQQLAHMTVNGASLRTGDLFASGTVSGPEKSQRGSLLELSWNGEEPFALDDGSKRTFLEDGDIATIRARTKTGIGFGEVTGQIRSG